MAAFRWLGNSTQRWRDDGTGSRRRAGSDASGPVRPPARFSGSWGRRGIAVPGAALIALAAGVSPTGAQSFTANTQPALTVSPSQVAAPVGQQSDQVTVKLRLPLQAASGAGTLLFRTLPPGVTTVPGTVHYQYSAPPLGALVAQAAGQAETTFRFLAGPAAKPGRYIITVADGTFAVGSAQVTLTVINVGDIGVGFRKAALALCGEVPVDDAVAISALSGYRGRLSVYWSSIPTGISVTPREFPAAMVPPAQALAFKVQAAGAKPGRYTLVLTVADRERGIVKHTNLEVNLGACGGIGIEFRKPSLRVCAGQETVDDAVALTPIGGYQGTPAVRWSRIPAGITITPAAPGRVVLPPSQALPFTVRSTGAAPGTYSLLLTATDAGAGVETSGELQLEVGRADFTPSVTPAAITVQAAPGSTGTLTARVEGNPCFAPRQVAVTVAGVPRGVTITPASATLTGPALAPQPFTLTVGRDVQAGKTYTLTFAFQPTPGEAKSVQVALTVTAAPDFDLAVLPVSAAVAAGDSLDVRVSARALNGFAGAISVTASQTPGLSVSPVSFSLRPGAVMAAVAGAGEQASQGVRVDVSRRVPPGQVRLTFTGTAPGAPGPHTTTLDLTVLPPRPTERVEGPRIDIVKPDTLVPGRSYELELTGKNLTLDTRLSLGDDITIVGPPVFALPTQARVRVQVGPAALPGRRTAAASNPEGSNRGPGGVMVELGRLVPTRPRCAKLTTLTTVPGKLELEKPEWGKQWIMEGVVKDIGYPLLDDDTVFQWREKSPGTADYFELRVYDKHSGALLVTRRLGRVAITALAGQSFDFVPRYFRPDAGFLAELYSKLPRRSTKPRSIANWAVIPAKVAAVSAGAPAAPVPGHASNEPKLSAVAAGAGAGVAPLSQSLAGDRAELAGAKIPLDPTAGADLVWEVAGFKLYDPECVTAAIGSETPKPESDGKIHQEVELSDQWPLRVPNSPTGIECGGGNSTSGSVNLEPLSDKSVLDENGNIVYDVVNGQKNPRIDPNNYPGDVFGLSGEFDLAFSPWAAHPKAVMEPPPPGGFVGNVAQFQFDTLFVDWGDGSVEPVRVVLPAGGHSSVPLTEWGRDVKIQLPNPKGQSPEPASLRHSYDRTGTYTIRFFQLAEGDAQHVDAAQLGMAIDGPQASPYLTLLALQGGGAVALTSAAGRPKAAPPSRAVEPAGVGMAAGGFSQQRAQATLAAWQLSSAQLIGRAYMLYCNTLTITTREDTRATGPLHLDAIAVIGFPGHGAPGEAGTTRAHKEPVRATMMTAGLAPVSVSTCDESLTAQATLRYYGRGRARITWMLDGIAFSTEEKDIGPSGQATGLGRDPRTWPPPVLAEVTLDSDVLSVEKVGLHKVTVAAEVVPVPTPVNLAFATDTIIGAAQGGTLAPGDLVLAKAILDAGHGAGRVSVLAPGSSAGKGLPAFVSLQSVAQSVLADVHIVKGKPLYVTSEPRPYQVVAAEAGQPCVFIFPTKLGEFRISGLEGNVTSVGTKYSGKGVLMLPLTKDSSSARKHAVSVTFSDWDVPDSEHVAAGTLDVSPARAIDGPGLQGTLTRLVGQAGTATELDVTLDLTLKDTTLRIPGGAEKPPEWKGVTAPVTGTGPGLVEGDWYTTGEKLPEVLIGWSAFKIRSDDVRFDWSRSQGDAASSQCGGGGGVAWVGVHLGHATLTPYTLDLVGEGGAYEQGVTDWGIVDAGMCGAITTKPWKAEIGEGWVGFDGIQLSAHGGTFAAVYKNMKVHVPWPETEFGGDAQLQSGGGKSAGIGFAFIGSAPLEQYNDAPNRISMKAGNLFFTQEENVGWAVRADTDFELMAEGKSLASFTADGMFFGFDGRAYFAKGAPSTTIALSGHAKLGDTPLDLNSVTLTGVTSGNDRLLFAVKVTSHLSETLPAAEAQVNYAISRPGKDYVGSGPVTSPFGVQVAFPAGSPALQANISPHYDGEQDTRFYGPVDLAMFGGPPVKAEFLLGYENGKSYWLTRAQIPLGPSGTPLVPPYLFLYAVRGGLGYNFPLDAFKNAGSIKDAQPDFSGNFMFMAGMRVGSSDGGFAFTFDGDLTISPSVGARMDFHAWLLKNQHDGNGDFAGYFQWANGDFDGRLWGGLSFLDVVKFDLGSSEATAAVALHFGSGDWYIHAGAKEGPRIKATLLNFGNVDSYLMLSSQGLETGGSMTIYLGCSIGHVKGWADVGLAITPAPAISGHADAGLEAEVCAFDACIGVGITAGINFSALPVAIGCHACVEIPIPLWNPEVCGDFSL